MKFNQEPGVGTLLMVILSTCLLLFLSQKLLWLVLPLLLALMLYYSLRPVKEALVACGVRHEHAAKAVWLVLQLTLIAAVLFVALMVPTKAGEWQNGLARYLDGGQNLLRRSAASLEKVMPVFKHMKLGAKVDQQVQEYSGQFVEKNLLPMALQSLEWIPSLLLVPYITFFMLKDSSRLKKYIISSVPNAFFEKALLLCSRLDASLQNYFQGLLLLTLLDTSCLSLGLAVLGIPYAIWLGLAAAVLSWIPYLGSIAGCIVVVLVAATDFPQQPWKSFACLVLFLCVRLLDDFALMPLTIGRKLDVHPLLSVLILFLGASVAGAAGLFLALPLFGVVDVIGESVSQVVTDQRLRARYRASRQLVASD